MNKKSPKIPSELEGVATTSDIDVLGEKVSKCYSSERYEEFQQAVEKITWRYIKSFIGFGVFLWLISLIASMLAQKYLNLF
jgi:hypothetical protein